MCRLCLDNVLSWDCFRPSLCGDLWAILEDKLLFAFSAPPTVEASGRTTNPFAGLTFPLIPASDCRLGGVVTAVLIIRVIDIGMAVSNSAVSEAVVVFGPSNDLDVSIEVLGPFSPVQGSSQRYRSLLDFSCGAVSTVPLLCVVLFEMMKPFSRSIALCLFGSVLSMVKLGKKKSEPGDSDLLALLELKGEVDVIWPVKLAARGPHTLTNTIRSAGAQAQMLSWRY